MRLSARGLAAAACVAVFGVATADEPAAEHAHGVLMAHVADHLGAAIRRAARARPGVRVWVSRRCCGMRIETVYIRATSSALVPDGQYKLELVTRRGVVRGVVIAEQVIEADRRETVYELAIRHIARSGLGWVGQAAYAGFHAECQLAPPPGPCLIAPANEALLGHNTPNTTLIALYRQALNVVGEARRRAPIASQDPLIRYLRTL